MKHLIILAFIIVAQQPAKPPESDGIPKTASSQVSEKPDSAKRNNDSPINGSASATQTASHDKNTAPTDENINIQRKLVLFTGLLVVVGFITAGAIIWQSWETRKAADAAKRSVELQAVQWVALKNWRTSCPRPDWLKIEVDIVNETNFPLTLQGAVFRVGAMECALSMEVTVVPKAKHVLDFNRDLTAEEQTNYVSRTSVFGIRGAISFAGISGKKVQSFGGLICASQSGETSFTSESAHEQSAKDHYLDKLPI
jgi:hypothetical protein